jgi:hypothetical protein
MKRRITRLPTSSCLLVQLVCTFGQLGGCGFEVENPGNPDPKPKTTTDTAKDTKDNTQAPAGSSGNLPALPNCSLVISNGAANSSGTTGAIVALPSTGAYSGATLTWQNASSGQVVSAMELIFLSTSMPAGHYLFKFTAASGRACNASVEITSSAINNNVKLTLEITVPD